MDVIFQLRDIEFEWDEEKYTVNLRKHSVKFEEAAEVFFDPLSIFEDASVEEESREYIIGFSFSSKMLFVVFVERGIRLRIISARSATSQDRKDYAEKNSTK